MAASHRFSCCLQNFTQLTAGLPSNCQPSTSSVHCIACYRIASYTLRKQLTDFEHTRMQLSIYMHATACDRCLVYVHHVCYMTVTAAKPEQQTTVTVRCNCTRQIFRFEPYVGVNLQNPKKRLLLSIFQIVRDHTILLCLLAALVTGQRPWCKDSSEGCRTDSHHTGSSQQHHIYRSSLDLSSNV